MTYWYKIRVRENDEDYSWVGSSPLQPNEVAELLAAGGFLPLENLLYMHKYQVKSFVEWDPTLVPVRYINGKCVTSFMQFRADPRTLEHKPPADAEVDTDGSESDTRGSWLSKLIARRS